MASPDVSSSVSVPFRVDEPPMDVDVEAELKSLQASIAQLQTENLGGMKDFLMNVRHI